MELFERLASPISYKPKRGNLRLKFSKKAAAIKRYQTPWDSAALVDSVFCKSTTPEGEAAHRAFFTRALAE